MINRAPTSYCIGITLFDIFEKNTHDFSPFRIIHISYCSRDRNSQSVPIITRRRRLNGYGGWIRTNGMADAKSAALLLGYAAT